MHEQGMIETVRDNEPTGDYLVLVFIMLYHMDKVELLLLQMVI